VRVITDGDGAFIEPYDVDLSDETQAGGRRIEQCLDAAALNIQADDYLLPR
jgi:hypothetical protein